MSCPASCFSLEISSTAFPLISRELFHFTSLRVLERTYLGRLFMRSAKPPGSVLEGQAAAKVSYVARPRRSAPLAKTSWLLNFIISSFMYGTDHFSGASIAPVWERHLVT